ncbi:NH(3)-dependent NAD(+) synthetase [Hasllibacter halocynthiae]|uniref:Glutamine-dependent NAD(+) synthetase n=1 Tax=Hasllibacter halocynthiae TaxID=595589 RepID=A0A2T0X9S1_9RHOB|nr:NAD+ synthase [Hasllibacter halocynthiae]PRY95692.1 NH(3)-dependent NAD(+) synthetase [Hasllibacter halocynthiae]
MKDRIRVTLAQLDPVVGDLEGNAAKARAAWEEGRAAGADLVALPEMFVAGYQTQDLVLRPAFQAHAQTTIERLATDCADGPALAIGGPRREGALLHNGYWILAGGRVRDVVLKHELPNFKVFDEKRLFAPGPLRGPASVKGVRVGFPVCEDAWHPDVAETLAETGAEMLLVPNGSPYFRDKHDVRLAHMVARTVETGLPLIYLNMAGGQDDQFFDGASFVLNPGGAIAHLLPFGEEAVRHVDLARTPDGWRAEPGEVTPQPGEWEADYRVMVEATRGYFRKTGFSKALLGLSGGIDSALVATIAADALGPGNVRGVMLPSRYTSAHSLEDAADCARRLGIALDTLPIGGPVEAVHDVLAEQFSGTEPGIAEENLQSRLRGLLLMALSNKTGEMLLTTGNKSEVAVGYATIYGDMSGGWNPIKDLYKMRVFETCRWRNREHRDWMLAPPGEVVPPRVISKAPSAELAADQRDEDSLPPYPVLDAILERLVDGDRSVADCVADGFDAETVRKVERLVYLSEYKRFQSAPGPRLTGRAFWLDRRYPIVNGWRDPTGGA